MERFDAASLMAAPASRSAPLSVPGATGEGAPGFSLPGSSSSAVHTAAVAAVPQCTVESVGGAKRPASDPLDAGAGSSKRPALGAGGGVHSTTGAILLQASANPTQHALSAPRSNATAAPAASPHGGVPGAEAASSAAAGADGDVSLSQEALRAVEAEQERKRRIEENKRLALQRRQALAAAPVNVGGGGQGKASGELNRSARSDGSNSANLMQSPGSPEM